MVLVRQDAVFLSAEQGQGLGCKVRGNHHFAKQRVKGFCSGHVHGAVGHHHAAKCGDGVSGQGIV